MAKCECLHHHGAKTVCYGTKEMEECSCGGEMSKCNFYPEKRNVTIDPESLRPKWISVEDRLPNYFEHVLINAPGDKPFTTVHEAHLRKDGLWDTGLCRYGWEDVTHWMPLPKPPRADMRGDT